MIQPQEELLPAPDEIPLLLSEVKLQKLREARYKTRLPQSLIVLTIKAVAKHCTRLIDIPDSPLKYLPNTIVQKFFAMLASGMVQLNKDPDFILTPLPHLKKTLGLLLNSSVTELDCSSSSLKLNNFLLKHALKNCPKIAKIDIGNPELFETKQDILPVLKKSWNNLKSITYRDGFVCNEHTLKLILENFPNIEELIISVTNLSQIGVRHLINMKKLHTLVFDDAIYSESGSTDFIIAVAGEVHSLQKFSFICACMQNRFIEKFSEKYPRKQLLVNQLTVVNGLNIRWPKNLSVRHLQVFGSLTPSDIENISLIECDLVLSLDCVASDQMYQVLEVGVGLHVKTLIITDYLQMRPDINYISSEIILERIIAACPNLEHIEFKTMRAVVQNSRYNLQPAAFKNCQNFSEELFENNEDPSSIALKQVYQKFLMGSEKCEKLQIKCYEQLTLVAQVALTYPASLRQLREVHNDFYLSNSFDLSLDQTERNRLCAMYHKCIYELVTCCPKLEKVTMAALYFGRKLSAGDCRFMATIKAIDPHVIEFCDRSESWRVFDLANELEDSD